MHKLIKRFNAFFFFSLLCSLIPATSFASTIKEGSACLGGPQNVIADVNKSVFNNPLVQMVFCISDSSNFLSDIFSEPGEPTEKMNLEMNSKAIELCETHDRKAYAVYQDTHANFLKYFRTNAYLCLSQSELETALSHSLFKLDTAPQQVK